MVDWNQLIEVTLDRQNIKYYKIKGYIADKEYIYVNPYTGKRHKRFGVPRGTIIVVPLYDMPQNSGAKFKITCDYCNKEFEVSLNSYTQRYEQCILKKDACGDCKIKKQNESVQLKYGVNTTAKLKTTTEKRIKTNLEKYGATSPAANKKVQEKMRNTMLERYGVDHNMKVPEIVQSVMISRSKTISENGKVPTSNQQIYLNNLLHGKLNFSISLFLADIKLTDNILIEYNGGGHRLAVVYGTCTNEEFDRKEIAKQHYFKDEGFNLITIESKHDYLPEDNIIFEMIEYAGQIFSQGRSWIVFDIDRGVLKYRSNIKTYNYGELRKISAGDLNE